MGDKEVFVEKLTVEVNQLGSPSSFFLFSSLYYTCEDYQTTYEILCRCSCLRCAGCMTA